MLDTCYIKNIAILICKYERIDFVECENEYDN